MVVEIGDFGFTTTATARMYAMLNQALMEIAEKRPWAWRETTSTLTFSGSSASPSNASFPVKAIIALTNPTTGQILQPVTRQQFQKFYPMNLTDAGDPFLYYFDGSTLKVYKVPGATVTLTCAYLQYQAAVTSASTEAEVLLPAQYHWIPIFLTLSRLYFKDDDLEMAKWARDEAERLEALMVADIESRTSYDRPMLVQDVDFDYDSYYN